MHGMSRLALSLTDLYAPIREDLAAAQRIFDDELRSDLAFVSELCDTVRSYRGKMLRPALLLLSARATGRVTPAHHTLAAVVETVHVATLVHDDVLDEADERRRRPTVRALAGNVAAILLGDYLISHAFHLCSSLDDQHASRRIGAATNMVCAGELLQNHARGSDRFTEADYLDIVRRKTGALTAVSCELGAYYANTGASVVAGARAFGMSVGVAFQIIDDVLDIVGDRDEMGKTLGLDVVLGKLTLPAIHCLAVGSPATSGALRRALRGEVPIDMRQVKAWLEETGSVQYAVQTARGQVEEAVRQLEVLPCSDAKTALTGMAEFIIDRRF